MENEAMEIMENVTDMVTEDCVGDVTPIDCQSTGASKVGAVVKGLCIVGAIAGAIVIKNRAKISDWADKQRIKKLEKKGYIIYTPATEADVCDCEVPIEE